MKYIKKICLALLLININLNATGPSYIEVELTPIATHPHGEVLFKTYHNVNGMGGYGSEGVKYGWLVVSAKGIWDEQVAFVGYSKTISYDKVYAKMESYRKGEINLNHPDKVLKDLMQKYHFSKDTPLIFEKFKRLALKPKQSCFQGVCIDEVLQQKTLAGYLSSEVVIPVNGYDYDDEGNVTKEPFFYKGVALVHNFFGCEESKEFGGRFSNLPFNDIGYRDTKGNPMDLGYDIEDIDGIILLNEHYIKKFSKRK